MDQKSYEEKNSLYLIPTPIGNMEDMTLRGIEMLKNCDIVFSEDTRETLKLLNYFDIQKKLVACHKFNEDKIVDKLLSYLEDGKNVALVSDRGTPAISDPGYVAAYNAINKGYNVIGLPGATAFVPALIMSGLNPNRFLFYGFLDSKKSHKKKELESLKKIEYTLIFYESPFRIDETLDLIKDVMGDRNISISREISKKHEEVYRGKISEIKDIINNKGEFVIIVEGNKEQEIYDDIDVLEHVRVLMEDGLSEKDAIKKVAKLHNLEKNVVYMKYHEVKNEYKK